MDRLLGLTETSFRERRSEKVRHLRLESLSKFLRLGRKRDYVQGEALIQETPPALENRGYAQVFGVCLHTPPKCSRRCPRQAPQPSQGAGYLVGGADGNAHSRTDTARHPLPPIACRHGLRASRKLDGPVDHSLHEWTKWSHP